MTTMQDFQKMTAAMEERVQQLAAEGISGPALIHRMAGHLPDLQTIWVGTTNDQLASLCQDYPGFYQYASVMEEAFEERRANPRPGPYSDLPVLADSLKRPLSDLLATAATLERGYQSFVSGNQCGVDPLGELNHLHGQWLVDRERFVGALNAAGVPQNSLDFIVSALDEMADRITQLKRRVLIP